MSTNQPKRTHQPKHSVKLLRKLAVERQLQDYVRPGDGYQGKHRITTTVTPGSKS